MHSTSRSVIKAQVVLKEIPKMSIYGEYTCVLNCVRASHFTAFSCSLDLVHKTDYLTAHSYPSHRSHSDQAQSIRKMSKRLEEFRELYPGDAERSALNVKHYAHMFSSPSSSSSSSSSSMFAARSSSSSSSSAFDEAHMDNKKKNMFSSSVAAEDPVQLLRNVPRPTQRGHSEGMHPQGIFKITSDKLVEVPYEPCTQDYTVGKSSLSFTPVSISLSLCI